MALWTNFLGLQEQRAAAYVSDYLPWDALIAPGILQNKDKALMRVWRVQGQDMVWETKEAQGAKILRINDVLKRLGGKYMLQSESQRTGFTDYPDVEWPEPVAALIDADRKTAITKSPGSRESAYYLTFTWQPPTKAAQQIKRLIVANMPHVQENVSDIEALAYHFAQETNHLMALLRSVLANASPCTTDDMLTYLHSTVSDRWHPVRWSGNALNIDTQIGGAPWIGGWFPQLGSHHIRTCSFVSFPATSHVGIVRQLEKLDTDYRFCVRLKALEKAAQAAVLRQTQYAWIQQERSFFTRLFLRGQEPRVIDSDATNKATETDAARQELGADVLAYGDFTGTITVWDTDPQIADEKLLLVRQTFEAQGFVLQPEEVHSRDAWCSKHPGNRYSSVRKTKQNTIFLAHILPGFHGTWMGPTWDDKLNGPPWYYAHTDESTIFRVVNKGTHDVGHFQFIGPTGTGKSTKLGLGIAQWFKYLNAQAAIWDVGRTGRLITLMLRGMWIDLGTGNIQLQPLRHIDQQAEFTWALEWLLRIVESCGVPADIIVQSYLYERLRDLAKRPPHARTFTTLVQLAQEQTTKAEASGGGMIRTGDGSVHVNPDKRERLNLYRKVQGVLRKFSAGGEWGFLLDGNNGDMDQVRLRTFEQKKLLSYPRLLEPTVQYLFHDTERQFSTNKPMLLAMEESALLAMMKGYKEQFDAWLQTARKEGVSVGFIINSLRQSADLVLGLLNDENCPTKIYFPNPEAEVEKTAEIYEQCGLNEEERRLIAKAVPYRDAYYTRQSRGRRLYHLPLSPFILDCLARNDDEDHEQIDKVLAQEGPEGFPAGWLRHCGYIQEAAYVDAWYARARVAEYGMGDLERAVAPGMLHESYSH